jgi:3-hydroxyisobutyrate dehydrogenase
MRVGWLGLGAMGAPMATWAARSGHSVRGYDIVPERAMALAGQGVQPTETTAAAVVEADVVVIMVATPGQLEQVLFAPGGVAAALPADAIVMIMATVGPGAIASAADRLAARGTAVVDAPVSRGVQRAAAGGLLIMVSGPDNPVARVQPLLSMLAHSAPVVGPFPGDGQRMKLVNQLLCGVHIAAAAEALAFAESLGLQAAQCWQVLRGRRSVLHVRRSRGSDDRCPVRPGAERDRHLRQGHRARQRGSSAVRCLDTAHHHCAPALPAWPRTRHGPPRRFRAHRGRAQEPLASLFASLRPRPGARRGILARPTRR